MAGTGVQVLELVHPGRAAVEQRVVGGLPKQLFIDGAWVDAENVETFEVVDPSTDTVLCAMANASPGDGMRALRAAAGAQTAFPALPPRHRSDRLTSAFRLLHERIDDLAPLMTLEMGKPLAESRGEIANAAEFFRHFAREGVRIGGGYHVAPAGGTRFLVTKQPVGPCLLITPYNFPMAMGTRKIGPAIAAGCASVVIKPAARTPLSMLALAVILRQAGVPDGVVNVVTTTMLLPSWSPRSARVSPASSPSPVRRWSAGRSSNNPRTRFCAPP